MLRLGAQDETRLFGELIEALREAEESSRALGAARRQAQWFLVGKQLGDMREMVTQMALQGLA